MGKLVEFRRRNDGPTIEELAQDPARSEATPEKQTGQPFFMLAFPDGRVLLRTTPKGRATLQWLSQADRTMPSLLGDEVRIDLSDLHRIQEALDEVVVPHVYRINHDEVEGVPFLERVGVAPLPSPNLRYCWLVSMASHGGLWLMGPSDDLRAAHESLLKLDNLITGQVLEDGDGAWTAFLVEGHGERFAAQCLRNDEFWLLTDVFWCDC